MRQQDEDYHWGINDQSDLGADYKHGFLKSLVWNPPRLSTPPNLSIGLHHE